MIIDQSLPLSFPINSQLLSNLNHVLFKQYIIIPHQNPTLLLHLFLAFQTNYHSHRHFHKHLACIPISPRIKWTRIGIYQRRKVQEVVTSLLRIPSRRSQGVVPPPNRHYCDVLHREPSQLPLPRPPTISLEVTRRRALLQQDVNTAAQLRNRRPDSTS